METPLEREARLKSILEKSLIQKLGSPGLISSVGTDGAAMARLGDEIIEPIKIEDPIEGASYDALMYIRAGLSYREILDAVLMRNRIRQADAETIIKQAYKIEGKTFDE